MKLLKVGYLLYQYLLLLSVSSINFQSRKRMSHLIDLTVDKLWWLFTKQ